MKKQVVVSLLTSLIIVGQAFNWNENVSPKLRVNYLSQQSDEVFSFLGNQTHKDHFKLLQTDGGSLLIGARNVVYNLSISDLKENVDQRISWMSPTRDREMCLVKGKSEDECQNYIRVLAITDANNLLVCGTNSFNPRCRTYTSAPLAKTNTTTKSSKTPKALNLEVEEFRLLHEFSGKGFCPPDPRHNSTAIHTGGELYSGTVSDFSGSDALIYRDNLRTEQYDLKHLNSPDFVSSTEDDDYVYYFFRESAVEYINCGKSIYSRVARVCKRDRGGPHKFQHRWTSFLKARLNCSVPGEIPFYFNEIQGTTDFINVGNNDKIIYGVFTTPGNAIAGSAICSFRLSDIRHAFDEAPFKGQLTGNSNWLPLRVEDVHSLAGTPTRPGQCVNDSTTLPESTLNFIKSHSLMDEAVPSSKIRMSGSETEAETNFDRGDPLLVKTSLNERLTVIGVDPQVRTPSGAFYDVIYVGSTSGKVLKVVSAFDEKDIDNRRVKRKPVIIEEIQLFPKHVPVRNIQVVSKESDDKIVNAGDKKLVVLSDFEVKSLPLHRCSAFQVQSCSACVALQDPHCAWNVKAEKCVDHSTFKDTDASLLIQDIFSGKHPECSSELEVVQPSISAQNPVVEMWPSMAPTPSTKLVDIIIDIEDNDIEDSANDPQMINYELPVQQETETLYGSSTFVTAVVMTGLACMAVGFGSGWLASRKCSKDDYRSCGHRYLEDQHIKNHESRPINESSYSTAPCNNLADAANKNNLLSRNLHINKTTELNEKNNLNNVALAAMLTSPVTTTENDLALDMTTPIKGSTDTSVIYSGTIPRNGGGTLCKKVYL